jgi:hypothetical protein
MWLTLRIHPLFGVEMLIIANISKLDMIIFIDSLPSDNPDNFANTDNFTQNHEIEGNSVIHKKDMYTFMDH